MLLNLSRLHWPITALGYGKRIGVWFQGCSIGCPGCCSLDTWNSDDTNNIEIKSVIKWIKEKPQDEIDGITISGGEPFDQPEALLYLLTEINKLNTDNNWDIIVYSGYPEKKLINRYSKILEFIDMLISEPYVERLQTDYLRGSANQKLHIISELGVERYGGNENNHDKNMIQMHFDGNQLWMIGIPQKEKQEVLLEELKEKGIVIQKASWMP